MSETNGTINSQAAPIGADEVGRVSISQHAFRAALRQAESAVDEIVRVLRETETRRDEAARTIGALQSTIEALTLEKDRRTAHMRALQATNVKG